MNNSLPLLVFFTNKTAVGRQSASSYEVKIRKTHAYTFWNKRVRTGGKVVWKKVSNVEKQQQQQTQTGPTKDAGGFVSENEFYDYMLNHAKNTSVEVAAFELKRGKEPIKYFVLPWKNNLSNKSRFSMDVSRYVKGYSQADIMGLYHTHPKSTPPSSADRAWSDKYNLPIYSIGANGTSYLYLGGTISPIDLSIYFGN